MALNNFTDNEAIDICIALRDNIELDTDLPLKERWRDKDAMAQVINLATEYVELKNKQEQSNG